MLFILFFHLDYCSTLVYHNLEKSDLEELPNIKLMEERHPFMSCMAHHSSNSFRQRHPKDERLRIIWFGRISSGRKKILIFMILVLGVWILPFRVRLHGKLPWTVEPVAFLTSLRVLPSDQYPGHTFEPVFFRIYSRILPMHRHRVDKVWGFLVYWIVLNHRSWIRPSFSTWPSFGDRLMEKKFLGWM